MRRIQTNINPTSTWEHFIPFLLMLLFVNGYLMLMATSIWSLLRSGGFGLFGAAGMILLILMAMNILCLLGYAMSRALVVLWATLVDQIQRR